ncbi:MAG: glutathione S-transferase family protein [Beijerinckiaceae bacterium]
MSLSLYAHPFSSYCQKVLVALHENGTPFQLKFLSQDDPETGMEFATLWPVQHMPLLRDGDVSVMESTIIIEHLQLFHPGPTRFLPDDPKAALRTRFMDRVFDSYVMAPMMRIVFDAIRQPEARDAHGVADARSKLDKAYAWLNGELAGQTFAAGDTFGLADCAAAPSLFYADWVHPIAAEQSHLRAYRQRLLTRPSFAKCVEDARPYRNLFPTGAPDRD